MRDGGFEPPQEALDVLKRLSDDDRNNVWLLSGLPVGGGLDKIAAALPNVGLWYADRYDDYCDTDRTIVPRMGVSSSLCH